MKSKFFLIIFLIIFINSLILSNEKNPVSKDYSDLVTAGFSVFYAGLGCLSVGIPMIATGTIYNKWALAGFGYAFGISGYICSVFVGPIISIVAYANLVSAGSFESNIEYNSGFWYGMGWASLVSGALLLALPLILTGGYIAETPLGIVLAVLSGLCYAAGAVFMGAAVTIPFVKIRI
jgi:hypothetical protein